MTLPQDFVWGAATSAYQIEGAHDVDGKGPSIWDAFCRQPGKVWSGHHGQVAADHYHRWREDLALMKNLGLKAYRFSVSWPRVLPNGTGQVNEPGMRFYEQLVDGLLEAGIQPWLTLFHWDYPLALHERGGWQRRESVEWFGEYAAVLARRLGDRVPVWMPWNEPQVFVGLGYGRGWHAPGLQLEMPQLLRVAHHVLMSHGRAVQAIRQHARAGARVGIAAAGLARYPATESDADVQAARQSLFWDPAAKIWNTAWLSDPIMLGHYPPEGLRDHGVALGAVEPRDLELMSQPLDFYGVNVYFGLPTRMGDDGQPQTVPLPPGHPYTPMEWPVTPQALRWIPRFVAERYRVPIVVTENGMSGLDWPSEDGAVHDPQRMDFLSRHIAAMKQAIADGVDVRGFLHWSLLDNFEWHMGYRQRFGLIHVDYRTLKRTPKDSARWYADVIAAHAAALGPQNRLTPGGQCM